ncbi:MAG TPA: FtsX-like permease family protein [Streptosporangiaceae bacterium]|nr:FtsX-like permease family protein [Streptosporangiaceae bacterium]
MALTVLITSAFTAAAAAFLGTVTLIAVRSELTRNPGSQIVVAAPVAGNDLARATSVVATAVRGPLGPGAPPPLKAKLAVSLQSGIMKLIGADGHGTKLETQLISLPALALHIAVVSGHCGSGEPGGPGGPGGLISACLPQTAARALGLAPGDRTTLRDTESGAIVRVLITGVFRPLQPWSHYWMLDPMGPVPVHLLGGLETAGPLVTSAATPGHGFTIRAAAWLAQPDFAGVNGSDLAAIGPGLGSRLGGLANTQTLSSAVVTTALPAELSALSTALVVARTELLAGLLTLLVVAGATLALAVRLLAQRRTAEAALLSARGASRAQLARRALVDAAIVAIPALATGPLLGTILALVLLRAGLRPVGIAVPALAPGAVSTAWLATVLVLVGCTAIIGLPWLRRPPSPLRRRAAQGRQRSIVGAVGAQADLAVVALAAAAAWQLIHSPSEISASAGGVLSADPILLIAPVLALVAGALLTLRLLPLAARLGDRLAARGRGLVMPVAAWQISRRTLRQAGPTLVGVLAVAAAVMALSQRDSWHGSVQAQASFDVGADTRITIPPAATLSIGQMSGIARAPGVTASTPAVRATISLPNGNLGTLLALDTASARAVIPVSAAGPSKADLSKLSAAVPHDGIELPGRPAALRLTASLGGAPMKAQPQLFLQLTDAVGIGYLLPAGSITPDGKPHTLTAMIAPGNRADYPLRLTGFSLQFLSRGTKQGPDHLTLSAGFTLARPDSTAGTSVRLAPAGDELISSVLKNPFSRPPTVSAAKTGGNGVVSVTFNQGVRGSFQSTNPTGFSVADRYAGLNKALPAVVTRSFLAATGSRIGGQLVAGVDGTTVLITPTAVLPHLPTMTNGSPGVLVDQGALTAVLQVAGAQPENVTEWWLRTKGHLALAGLPPGTSTAVRARLVSSLLADPLSLASQQALLALAVAAVLLAIIGMLVSIATASERSRDLALLDALGMPPRQIARLLGLEQGLTAVAPSAIGLLFGAALSELIIPAVTLTPRASRPIPPVAVQVPWLIAIAIALAMAVLPTLTIVLALPRRQSGAARIRMEEEA